ncbi:MAG: hypothetical protein ABSH33_23080 [Steroidobacteraceae bacterium]
MRTMKPKSWMAAAVIGFGTVGLAQANMTQPGERALTSAVTQYLSDHGDLCVGKFTWPRIVTPEDRLAATNDAVQLPVLERLGLVESTEFSAAQGSHPKATAATAETARRYALTAKGRQYYLQRKRITLGAHDQPVEHDEDLCVAHLTLDRVVKWSPPERAHGHLETMVHYTYHIKSADWMADTEARRVFPIVDRIIRGQGNLLMSVNVQLRDGTWRPVLPGQ